jgi:hypothetical protein
VDFIMDKNMLTEGHHIKVIKNAENNKNIEK